MRSWPIPTSSGRPQITAEPTVLTPLPGGPINHHWTKDLALSPDGRFLYASVGSNSNAAERGLEAEKGRAAIWQVDRADGRGARLRLGPAQSERADLPSRDRRAVDGRQRARRTRAQPRAGLHDLGAGGRLLRLALELLRRPCRRAGASAAAGHGGEGDHARLCAVEPCRGARPDLLERTRPCRSLTRTAPSSASTAAGTATPSTATRWSTCRSRTAGRPARRRTW